MRVQLVDFEDLAAGYQSVGELLASLNCSPENTDLILDLGPVGPDSSAAVLVAVMAILQNLPNVARWRSLVLNRRFLSSEPGRSSARLHLVDYA